MRMKKKSVIRAGMSDEKFYTRDFPNVKVGQVKVAPHRGDYTVFIGLSDGTIAYQWCESKAAAQREAEYARGIVKKYGSDAPYWVEEGYKIWNPNVKSTSSMSRRRHAIHADSRLESSRRIRASKSFDPNREQLDLSEEGAYIIRELENEYGVKMPERGWGQVMDYIEDMVRDPSIYRSSGPAHDFYAMSIHLESVIYDIYEELTGVTVV